MKRLSALFVAIALSISLVACGSESAAPDASSAESTQTGRPTASASVSSAETPDPLPAVSNPAASVEPPTEDVATVEDAGPVVKQEEPPASDAATSTVEENPAPQETTQPAPAAPAQSAAVETNPQTTPDPTPAETPAAEPTPQPEPEPQPAAPVVTPAAPANPPAADPAPSGDLQTAAVIGNKNTKKFHEPSCKSVKQMKESNKVALESSDAALAAGYEPCQNCH